MAQRELVALRAGSLSLWLRWAALLGITSVTGAAAADVGVQVGPRGGVALSGDVDPYVGLDIRLSVPSSPLLLQPTFDYIFDEKQTLYQIGLHALFELPVSSRFKPYFGVGVGVSAFKLRANGEQTPNGEQGPTVDDQGNRVGLNLLVGARWDLPWVSPFLQVTQGIGELHALAVGGGLELTLHERREASEPSEPPEPVRFAATPYIANNVVGDVQSGRIGLGLSLAYYPWEHIGFELDAEMHGHFFRDEDVATLATAGVDLNTNAALFSGSLVGRYCWRNPSFGAWCPYATAGAGFIHPWFDAVAVMPGATSFTKGETDPALTVGLGLTHQFTRYVGLRADARYFRALVGEGGYVRDYGFLRMSAGVSIGFR